MKEPGDEASGKHATKEVRWVRACDNDLSIPACTDVIIVVCIIVVVVCDIWAYAEYLQCTFGSKNFQDIRNNMW